MTGHGYREAARHLAGESSLEEAIERHRAAHAAVREAPADLVPPRPAHHVAAGRRRPGRRSRAGRPGGARDSARAQLTAVSRRRAVPSTGANRPRRRASPRASRARASSASGAPEEVALAGLDAERGELRELRRVLDALGDDEGPHARRRARRPTRGRRSTAPRALRWTRPRSTFRTSKRISASRRSPALPAPMSSAAKRTPARRHASRRAATRSRSWSGWRSVSSTTSRSGGNRGAPGCASSAAAAELRRLERWPVTG